MTDSDIPPISSWTLTAGGKNGQWPGDNARAPLRWDSTDLAGFTTGTPWFPLPDDNRVNVADQQKDPHSTLTLIRSLIALCREAGFGMTRAIIWGVVSCTAFWRWPCSLS
ncbi:hypothetical protein [Streptomyces sp. NPDC059209]|uniref:alpha-amylase family glycosyl hydrolase n=1 Tax=Streptomyces sp. NPDC059209 TaxID=3346769 RepID=UPI00368E2663